MRLTNRGLRIRKIVIYRAFVFFLIVLSIFRARIPVPFGLQYLKVLEAYVLICLPLIVLMLAKNLRSIFTFSSLFLVFLFAMFYTMNYISSKASFQYIPSREALLYCFRLGLIFVISLTLLVIMTSKYPLLIGSVYKGFWVAGLLILLWIVFFPEFKTSLRRFTGPLGDPNYTAAFLIISLNVATYLALIARKVSACLAFSALAVAFFATIVVSLSRGALLGALASLFVLVWAVVISRSRFIQGIVLIRKSSFRRAITGLLILMGSIILVFASQPDLFNNFTERLSPKRIVSQEDQHRQSLWRVGVRSIVANPIGYGMGQMRAKHQLLGPESKLFGHSTEVHNIVLQVGGAFGWPGLCLFVVFLLFLLSICFKLLRRKHYAVDSVFAYPVPLATSFVGLFVQGLLFNFLYLKHFWIVAVLVLAYHEYEKRKIRLGLKTTF